MTIENPFAGIDFLDDFNMAPLHQSLRQLLDNYKEEEGAPLEGCYYTNPHFLKHYENYKQNCATYADNAIKNERYRSKGEEIKKHLDENTTKIAKLRERFLAYPGFEVFVFYTPEGEKLQDLCTDSAVMDDKTSDVFLKEPTKLNHWWRCRQSPGYQAFHEANKALINDTGKDFWQFRQEMVPLVNETSLLKEEYYKNYYLDREVPASRFTQQDLKRDIEAHEKAFNQEVAERLIEHMYGFNDPKLASAYSQAVYDSLSDLQTKYPDISEFHAASFAFRLREMSPSRRMFLYLLPQMGIRLTATTYNDDDELCMDIADSLFHVRRNSSTSDHSAEREEKERKEKEDIIQQNEHSTQQALRWAFLNMQIHSQMEKAGRFLNKAKAYEQKRYYKYDYNYDYLISTPEKEKTRGRDRGMDLTL